MKLTLDKYIVSRKTLEVVLEALESNLYTSSIDGDYNNENVIDADKLLRSELKHQESNAKKD